jgi:glutathione peroxidase
MRTAPAGLASVLVLSLATVAVAAEPSSLYDLSAAKLGGAEQSLAAYRGKVVLVVNTASECGFTPQYQGLEALYEELAPKGLVILGFPSNDFGGQEPGSAAEIRKFCELRFHVTFPMFEKVRTKGEGQSPVYRFLTRDEPAPKWNFHKYLVGRDGRVVGGFESAITPDSKELRAAVEKALAAK